MKTFLLSALALISALAFTPPAHAIPDAAKSVRILFSSGAALNAQGFLVCTNCGNVGTSTWVDLVASLPKAAQGVSIYSLSQVPFQLAIGTSGAEQVQLVIPAGAGNDGMTIGNSIKPGLFFYPVNLSQGTKVSIRALNSSATAGELDANFFYY